MKMNKRLSEFYPVKGRNASTAAPALVAALLCLFQCSHAPAAELHVPAQYPTIQTAVDAAQPGDTIRIAAGDYYQQVVIESKNNITLAGEPGAAIHAFYPGMVETLKKYNWLWFPMVAVYRSSGVVVSGLTIDGDHLAGSYTNNPEGTLPSRLIGVYFLGAGGDVTNCTVRNFRTPDPAQSTDANGLQAFNPASLGSPVTVRVLDSRFENNQLPLFIRGDPANNPADLRVTTTIKGNTITGIGPSPVWSLGIWLVCGVAGDVVGNTMSDFVGTGLLASSGMAAYDAAAQTHGRYVPLQKLNFESNTFRNNGQHLFVFGGNDCPVTNNTFQGSIPGSKTWGGVLLSGTNMVVANNNFADMPTGVYLLGVTNYSGWPKMIPAVNPTLRDNWFCNVTDPVYLIPGVIGLTEHGTQRCEQGPLYPRFQSMTGPGPEGVALTLRSWHEDTVVIEESTNLVDWVPTHTNLLHLPLIEYKDPGATGKPQCFYRARPQ